MKYEELVASPEATVMKLVRWMAPNRTNATSIAAAVQLVLSRGGGGAQPLPRRKGGLMAAAAVRMSGARTAEDSRRQYVEAAGAQWVTPGGSGQNWRIAVPRGAAERLGPTRLDAALRGLAEEGAAAALLCDRFGWRTS